MDEVAARGRFSVLCCVGDVRLHVCVCAGEGGVLTAAVTGQNSGKDHTGVRDNHTLPFRCNGR